ncbi:MAG TPA: ThiF family adenylyltransferase [Actinophytocola sp.]|uniref:HesA/MoeB/ThiF family protein n=1 Tax=Actinophytocola sp. TaxID=1872138 RepID=UPI002DDD7C63|nr:ThiF family adenylyltransferase [Actinophytocola sp.]HEV2782176.1 ThiF family adenylyltransferase [Actinophytocola sp.]
MKELTWQRVADELVVAFDPSEQIVLADPSGQVEALFRLLREGTRDTVRLAGELAEDYPDVTATEVESAIEALDSLRLLENAEREPLPDGQVERYFSNLAFFETFASLDRSAEDFQRRLLDSHVVVLGAGGLGSTVLLNLAGLGVGRLTVLDHDRVEPRNFARQFLYSDADIGSLKVERAAARLLAFHPGLRVRTVARRVTGPADVAPLLPDADLLITGVDRPDEVDVWVNEACLAAGVPYVRGGMLPTRVVYWSVDPGRSACYSCALRADALATDGVRTASVARRLAPQLPAVNRGIGPVASLVGSLVAMEALRYLTGFAAPAAAGRFRVVDFRAGGTETDQPWPRDPDCAACAAVPTRPAPAGVD